MHAKIVNKLIAVFVLCVGYGGLPAAIGGSQSAVRNMKNVDQPTILAAADGLPTENFGTALALDGVWLAVGAPRHVFLDGPQQGGVYLYAFNGAQWFRQALLAADDGGPGDYFGGALALADDTLIVSAERHDVNERLDQGAVYDFHCLGGRWIQRQKLVAPDGAPGDQFGQTVLLVGDTLFVGAGTVDSGGVRDQGAVYRFDWVAEGWRFAQKLLPVESSVDGMFGTALAASGETLVVGAPGFREDGRRDRGAAFVFTRTGNGWKQVAKLAAEDGDLGDNFGVAVAIVDDIIAVGADHDNVAGGGDDQGSVYLFRRDLDHWQQDVRLTGFDGHTDSYFGHAIALVGDRLTVGAWGQRVGSHARQGAAYLFDRVGQQWSWQQQLTAPDGSGADWFARAIVADDQTVVIGAPQANVGENSDQGKVYVYGTPMVVPPGERKLFLPIMHR